MNPSILEKRTRNLRATFSYMVCSEGSSLLLVLSGKQMLLILWMWLWPPFRTLSTHKLHMQGLKHEGQCLAHLLPCSSSKIVIFTAKGNHSPC